MSAENFTLLFLGFFVLAILVPKVQDLRLRRLVTQSIGLDRICRHTDLSENELEFRVLASSSYLASATRPGGKRIAVAFSFKYGNQGNGWVSLEPMEVDTLTDNKGVEAHIILQVKRIKAGQQ